MRFREEDHPRGGEGTKEGGRFVPKGHSGTPTSERRSQETDQPKKKSSGERIRGLISKLGSKIDSAELADDWVRHKKLTALRDKLKSYQPEEKETESPSASSSNTEKVDSRKGETPLPNRSYLGRTYFHGTGQQGISDEPSPDVKFDGALHSGRIMWVTPQERAANLYGAEVWEFEIDANESEVLELGRGEFTLRDWFDHLGIPEDDRTPEALKEKYSDFFYPHVSEALENYGDEWRYRWGDLLSKDGDAREYDPEGEAKIASLLKKTRPEIKAVGMQESYSYTDKRTKKLVATEYEAYMVLDQEYFGNYAKVGE